MADIVIKTKTDLKNKLFKILTASLLLSMNFFIFGTFTVYVGNSSEFEFGYLNLLVILILPAIITVFIFMFAGIFIPNRKINIYVSIIFIVGVLLWIQSSFFVWDYGVFDGRGLKWKEVVWQGWFEISVWLTLIIIAVIFSHRISKYSSFLSIVLIVLQMLLAINQGISAKENIFTKKYSPQNKAPEEIFNYSSTMNAIHIIFDAFQTDTFLKIVKEESLESELDGFTLFKDNMGVAPSTTFSLPAIFSGDIYDGSVPISEYFDRSFSKKGFQNVLYDQGFTVNLIPTIPMRKGKYTNYYPTPSFYGSSPKRRALQNATYLMDIVLFRQTPHHIKKYIYNNGNWRTSRLISLSPNVASFHQKAFFQDYINSIHPKIPGPAYHFMHLNPPHPPYVTDKNGKYAGGVLAHTKENYENEARHILRAFIKLLKKIKKIGLYDSSLIVLHGDHGGPFPPVIDGNEIDIGLPRVPALLIVKPPQSKGRLKISNAKTSVADIPATIMDYFGIKNEFKGESLLTIDPEKNRNRVFIVYVSGKKPVLHKYIVNGSVYGPNSWSNKVTVSASKIPSDYIWGSEIKFGVEGNAGPFKGQGWCNPLSEHAWNNGHKANFNFIIGPPEHDVVFEAQFIPFIHPGKVERQRIKVIVNGRKITEWIATEKKIYSFQVKIPKEFISSPNMTITFELPDAVAPRAINAGGDIRVLAIAMVSARMYQTQ